MQLAVFVRQRERLDRAAIDRRDVDAAFVHQPGAEGKALGRVVVAADHKNRQLPRRKPREKIVAQGHRLCGRHALVIDIARNEHTVRLLVIDDRKNAL